jgi:hypothetical protein
LQGGAKPAPPCPFATQVYSYFYYPVKSVFSIQVDTVPEKNSPEAKYLLERRGYLPVRYPYLPQVR